MKPQRYTMNYDWIWGPDNPMLDKAASITASLDGGDPEQLAGLLQDWLSGLNYSPESGHYYQGGSSVNILRQEPGAATIEFISGGQDVAESLAYSIDEFHDQVLAHLDNVTVTWTENPLEQPDLLDS